MREVKFRGKRIDNGEWVYGYIWIVPGVNLYYILTGKINIIDYTVEKYEIAPKTLGQYTGLKDKNSKEIYEGNIVKTYNGDKGIVKFGEHKDVEMLERDEDYYTDADGEERKTVGFFVEHLNSDCCSLDNKTGKWIEIIGSIHENPELLELRS